MTFSEWRAQQTPPPSIRSLGRELSLSHGYVCLLMQGRRTPSIKVATRIAEFTEGAVPLDSWRR